MCHVVRCFNSELGCCNKVNGVIALMTRALSEKHRVNLVNVNSTRTALGYRTISHGELGLEGTGT